MQRPMNRHERRGLKHRLRERNPPSSPPRPVAAGRTVLVESSHAERRRLAKSSDSTSISGNP